MNFGKAEAADYMIELYLKKIIEKVGILIG
jgi:hypothetical protein